MLLRFPKRCLSGNAALAKQLGDTSKVDALGKEMEKLPALKQASTP